MLPQAPATPALEYLQFWEDYGVEDLTGLAPGLDSFLLNTPTTKYRVIFVGEDNELFPKILDAMKLSKQEVALVRTLQDGNDAEVLVALGETATVSLLGEKVNFSAVRGQWQEAQGRHVMPTYALEQLRQKPELKKPVWEDMKRVLARLAGEK